MVLKSKFEKVLEEFNLVVVNLEMERDYTEKPITIITLDFIGGNLRKISFIAEETITLGNLEDVIIKELKKYLRR